MRYQFGGLIFGGAYFRNFTVYKDFRQDSGRCIFLYEVLEVFGGMFNYKALHGEAILFCFVLFCVLCVCV